MMTAAMLVTVWTAVIGLAVAGNVEFSQPLFPDSEFIDLISRASEPLPGPVSYGHKYITGGAGEGDQRLHSDESFEHREEVKSDSVLPAYCEPPNPCPVGYSGADGCLEEFDNTAEFSRNYQAQQQCLCDQEHMFNCPSKTSTEEYEQGLDEVLAKNGLHKGMIAKKFHQKRSEEPRRKKRSVMEGGHKPNPYLVGPHLRTEKKNGQHVHV
jgi:hypothetical protein